jgi:tRNA (guanine26-N2/guanine27-N2)-dimethyltransferase
LQSIKDKFLEITEGTTKLLVPEKSMKEKVPPKEPAFFNPVAKLNRDFSILAYSAFWEDFEKPKIFLEGLSGLGARSLRVSNEIPNVEKVIANDVNSNALHIANDSAKLNNITNFETSENETCRFFSLFSKRGNRGSIIDIDPFGSPTRYFDCAIRATMHGGLMSITATDLQVLHGLAKKACKRKYHGVPIKTEYSNEIAIRLILGCLDTVAGRLDTQIQPQFVENDMHYYRVYVKILTKKEQDSNMGYISHCFQCGNRVTEKNQIENCNECGSKMESAGPLWVGSIFEKEFIEKMKQQKQKFVIEKKCEKILDKSILEAGLPATYFTLDEIASMMKTAPLKLERMIEKIKEIGFNSSVTSLNPNGFRTNCSIKEIKQFFS